jgi:hypothetical protein
LKAASSSTQQQRTRFACITLTNMVWFLCFQLIAVIGGSTYKAIYILMLCAYILGQSILILFYGIRLGNILDKTKSNAVSAISTPGMQSRQRGGAGTDAPPIQSRIIVNGIDEYGETMELSQQRTISIGGGGAMGRADGIGTPPNNNTLRSVPTSANVSPRNLAPPLSSYTPKNNNNNGGSGGQQLAGNALSTVTSDIEEVILPNIPKSSSSDMIYDNMPRTPPAGIPLSSSREFNTSDNDTNEGAKRGTPPNGTPSKYLQINDVTTNGNANGHIGRGSDGRTLLEPSSPSTQRHPPRRLLLDLTPSSDDTNTNNNNKNPSPSAAALTIPVNTPINNGANSGSGSDGGTPTNINGNDTLATTAQPQPTSHHHYTSSNGSGTYSPTAAASIAATVAAAAARNSKRLTIAYNPSGGNSNVGPGSRRATAIGMSAKRHTMSTPTRNASLNGSGNGIMMTNGNSNGTSEVASPSRLVHPGLDRERSLLSQPPSRRSTLTRGAIVASERRATSNLTVRTSPALIDRPSAVTSNSPRHQSPNTNAINANGNPMSLTVTASSSNDALSLAGVSPANTNNMSPINIDAPLLVVDSPPSPGIPLGGAAAATARTSNAQLAAQQAQAAARRRQKKMTRGLRRLAMSSGVCGGLLVILLGWVISSQGDMGATQVHIYLSLMTTNQSIM